MQAAFDAKLVNTQLAVTSELRDSQGELLTWEERA